MVGRPLTIASPFYFMRHGQTDWNVEGRFQGQTDVSINAIGRAQARRNGEALIAHEAGIARWNFVASPLSRTRETMEIARRAMGLDPYNYRVDDRLKEVSFGVWERRTFEELELDRPDLMAERAEDKWHFVPEGGESYAALAARVEPVFRAIDRPTVIVAHGGVMRALFWLTAHMDSEDASGADIPQDRVLHASSNGLRWI